MMNWDSVHIGAVPWAEEGTASIIGGTFSVHSAAAYRRQLERTFPVQRGLPARFTVRQESLDGEVRSTVVLSFDGAHADAVAFVRDVCEALPANWDDQAIFDLGWQRSRDAFNHAVANGKISSRDVPDLYRGKRPPETEGLSLAAMLAKLPATVLNHWRAS